MSKTPRETQMFEEGIDREIEVKESSGTGANMVCGKYGMWHIIYNSSVVSSSAVSCTQNDGLL